jgi:hypothetical protein
MADFGGHIRFTYDGNPLVIRGKFEIEPIDEEFDIVANYDGSIATTAKPKGFRFAATFQDSPAGSATQLDWNAIIKGAPYNITIPEDETGVLHTFTACKLFGRNIRTDRMNGEVTGIEGASAQYKRTSTT